MTKEEICNRLLPNKTFDYALPQHWVDMLYDKYRIPFIVTISSFVWLYDEKSAIFGRPYPLNIAGWVACKIIGEEWI